MRKTIPPPDELVSMFFKWADPSDTSLGFACLPYIYLLQSSRRKTKWPPVSNRVTLKQVKLLFGPLIIQLVWYILQLYNTITIIHLSVCESGGYLPPVFGE